jgi:hypothetical protein
MGVGDHAKKALEAAVEKGVEVQQPAVEKYIARAKQRNPSAAPAEVIASLEKQYLSAVVALGGASGASAAAPAIGTGAGLLVNIAEVGAFFEASALFSLAVAEVHGVHIDDLERRRTLLMAVLMGSRGSRIVEKAAGRTGPYWASSLVNAVPMTSINSVNKVLGPRFVTRYGSRQGILVLARDIPYGIGAAIGVVGNAALGRMTISGARRAFGPPPQDWPRRAALSVSSPRRPAISRPGAGASR